MKQEQQKTVDKLFEDKLIDYEFSHKDASWRLLNYMLIEQQRKKTLLFRIKALFIFISIISIALLLWNSQHDNTLKSTLIANTFTKNSSYIESKHIFQTHEKSTTLVIEENVKETINLNQNFQSNFQDNNNLEITTTPPNLLLSEENVNHALMNNVAIANVSIGDIENNGNTESEQYITSSSTTVYVNWNQERATVKIDNFGMQINSSFADYAPVINADGSVMYFTSRRPITDKQKKNNSVAPESIYAAFYDASEKTWTNPILLPNPINQSNRFNSIIGLSNDGERMLLYRDDKYGNGDIYESLLNGREWSNPSALPEPINSMYIETSASISPDGRTIYFVSNRPGGQGGLDIYYCTKNNQDEWGEAKSLGISVNTPENEEGVYIHPDGKTLYFSSKGHGGEGGYDIFYTQLENGYWTTPQNLGKAVNSPNDDVYFVMEANGKVGYFSSIREGGEGEKDIYRIEFIKEEESDKGPLLTLFKGLVIDKETREPLNAEIEIIDLEKNELITTLTANAAKGNFMVSLPSGKNYGINVKKEGYLFYSDNINIPKEASYQEIIKTLMLERLKPGSKIILKNIFYDYDNATLREESKIELDKLYDLLIKNPNLKVELSAHTDSRGSDVYNNKLSQERAQACVDYLIEKGISKERIIAKGYGKQQLLISDEQIYQQLDESEAEALHQQNRRTEIRILEN